MALNAKKVQSNNTGGNKAEPLEAGTYPARVVQVIDYGVQEQQPFQGKPKPPAHELSITYELSDEFMKDEDGNDIPDKPRWVSETFTLNPMSADLAKSTKRYMAIDPQDTCDGDFTKLVEYPCLVGIVQKPSKDGSKIYNNVHSVSAVRPKDAARQPQLVNPVKVFVLDEPDLEVFQSLPEFVQEKIKKNLHFKGSALEALLKGGKAPAKQEEPAEEEDNGKW